MCGPPNGPFQDPQTWNQAAATGKLVFTVPSGGTARCTGTMIYDEPGSFTPYLYGANHCFETAYEAFTLNVWWFFDATACGSPTTPGDYVVQTGGAALLGRSQDWDWALLRLNTMPPAGVYFSGWNAATVGSGIEAEIFHHPSGDLKKWSSGTTYGNVPVDFASAAGGAGLFTRVVWDQGTTEGGSSGGGLVTFDFAEYGYVLRGGLLGGDALCSNPTGSDYFSQFGSMLPLVRQYLTPGSQVPGLVVSVEYYHANLDHYFMTIDPNEIAALMRARSSAGSAPASGSSLTTRRGRAGTRSAASTASRRSATRTSSPRTRRNARASRSTTRPTGISKARRSTMSRSRMGSRAPARPGRSRSTGS